MCLKEKVTMVERGWAGHFILGHKCYFHRNTLLTYEDQEIIVSTVGRLPDQLAKGDRVKFMELGDRRYFETMAFHANKNDKRYHDMDVTRQVKFDSPWSIAKLDADDKANDMHEAVVAEITQKLVEGVKV